MRGLDLKWWPKGKLVSFFDQLNDGSYWRQPGRPWPWSLVAWRSSLWAGELPLAFVLTARAIPCFSATYKKKGLFKLARPRAGAPVRACLLLQKAFSCSPFQSKGSVSGSLMASYRGLGTSPNPGFCRILPCLERYRCFLVFEGYIGPM